MRKWMLPLLLAIPAAGQAQAMQCAIPDALPRPNLESADRNNPKRLMPIGSYTLALSWSPGYCQTRRASARDGFQCGKARQPFGFVLHGLWPDGQGDTWPQYCRPAHAVPEPVIRDTLCATPSVQLIQHEWAKHGTCMSPNPTRYFRQSTGLYRALRFPDMTGLAARNDLTTADFARAFAAGNPGIPAKAVRVTTSRGGWLDEIWLCLNTRLRYAACRANAGGGDATRLRITPRG